MKALKAFGRFLILVLVIVVIFVIAIICSYVLGKPNTNTGTDSRSLVSGPWVQQVSKDKDEVMLTFDFKQSGEFEIIKEEETIADGWFKIDTKGHKIKMLMLPTHYSSEFEPYVKYKVLAEVSYQNLDFELKKNDNNNTYEIEEDNEPEVTFLMRTQESGEAEVYDCKMFEYTLDLYASEHDLTKDA